MTSAHIQTKATTSSAIAKIRALRGSMTPVTRGRLLVRRIRASMSRSTYMLMALAPPAAKAPPSTVATTNHPEGSRSQMSPEGCSWAWATTIVGTVVTSRSSMMRGLVSAT